MRVLAWMSVIVGLGFGAARGGDQEKIREPLPRGQDVIERHLALTNVRAVLGNTRCVRQSGRAEFRPMDLEATFELWRARDGRYLKVYDFGPSIGAFAEGIDGGCAWESLPVQGRLLTGCEKEELLWRACYDWQLRSAELFESIENLGQEEFEGVGCYKIKLVVRPRAGGGGCAKEIRTLVEYYEVESGLRRGWELLNEGAGGRDRIVVVIKAYKESGAGLFEADIVQRCDDIELETFVDSIEWDPKDESRFVPPPKARALLEDCE